MEDFGAGPRFDSMTTAVRRKRSHTFRRPRPDSQPYAETNDESPMSSNPASDDVYKASSDENGGSDLNSNRKEFSLNQCISRASSSSGLEGERPYKRDRKDGGANSHYSNEPARSGSIGKRSSEGVLAPSHWKSSSTVNDSVETESRSEEGVGGLNGESPSSRQSGLPADGVGSDSKVKKVKLRVCGMTRTIEANSVSNGGSSAKSARHPDASRHRPKNSIEGNSEDHITSSDKKAGLQGIPWKDFLGGGYSLGKDELVMGKGKSTSGKEADKSEPVRKSKRVPKRRVLDTEFGDDEEDDEIRYLEKLKNSRVSAGHREDDEEPKKHRKLSVVSNIENGGGSRSAKEGKKKPGADTRSGDTDYEEEDESPSDGDLVGKNKKKKQPGKEPVDSPIDGKREITLTTRQRALQSSKETTSTPGASLIEFPNGLPPAPSRRQKEKLTDVEQQLKKAEAAQRRKLQVEKAARESEAEAIKKILGQDSSRKKREDKNKKRQEELAQSKAAVALLNASSTVRVVMGPAGTVVTFPQEMGLPSIFNSKPHSYPPPRENCAGPLCTNPYKYRDSKSKLPLCSLQCYKAVQGKSQAETTF